MQTTPALRRFPAPSLPLLAFLVLVGFGWEDVSTGPYHHNVISQWALEKAGYRNGASKAVAWHSYKIDDYGYSPIWWAKGGWNRFEVSLATKDRLAHLHFDDLYSTDRVLYAYRRYLTGAVDGLIWAAEHDRISDAQNLLGVSLHAIQDFYSHSNWVDEPARRAFTFFEMPPSERRQANLYTGGYEGDIHKAPSHHGEINPSCSLLSQGFTETVTDAFCAINPAGDEGLCRQKRECEEAETIGIAIEGIEIPEGAVYLSPTGMALDNTWMAAVGGRKRGLFDSRGRWRPGKEGHLPSEAECEALTGKDCNPDSDHLYLFAAAKKLAQEASYQWLMIVEAAMAEAGHAGFWDEVKGGNPSREYWYDANPNRIDVQPEPKSYLTKPFEHYAHFPHQFLGAGYYLEQDSTAKCLYGDGVFSSNDTCLSRGAPVDESGEQHFLRVLLETSSDDNAGTDADLMLKANGREFLLDNSPGVPEPHGYNDLEQGDHQVYTVGPFETMPREITLENRASDAGDVVSQMWTDFTETVDEAWEWTEGALTNEADYVGEEQVTLKPEDLAALRADASQRSFRTVEFEIDGGSEGEFRVMTNVIWTGRSGGTGLDAWNEYEIKPLRLYVDEESDVDGLSTSDEPFVLFMMAEHGTVGTNQIRARGHVFGPFGDMDTGSRRALWHRGDYLSFTTRIRNTFGMITLAAQVWDHDEEDASDRRQKLDAMTGELDGEPVLPDKDWMDRLAASVAEDWKLEHLTVTGFSRGRTVRVGDVLDLRTNEWIDGGEERTFRLGNPVEYDISFDDLSRWPTPLNPRFIATEDYLIADTPVLLHETAEEEEREPKRPRRAEAGAEADAEPGEQTTQGFQTPSLGPSLTAGYLHTRFSYNDTTASPYDFSGTAPALRLGWQSGALTLSYNRRAAQSLEGRTRPGRRSFTADLQAGGDAYLVRRLLRQPLAFYVPFRFNGSYRYVSPLAGETDGDTPPALHLAGAGLGAGAGLRIAPPFGPDFARKNFVAQATYVFTPGLIGRLGGDAEGLYDGPPFAHPFEDFKLRRAIAWDFEVQFNRLISNRVGLTLGYTLRTVSRSSQQPDSFGDVLDLFADGSSFREVSDQHMIRVGLSW